MTVAALRRFAGDRKGNVAIIFALSLMPIALLTGMGIDYTSAASKKAMLDAAADAAALAAVTPTLMALPSASSITAAQNMFNSQVTNIPGLSGAPTPTVNAVDNGLKRTVTVSYTASSRNSFAGVLGQAAWALNGSSQATASVAPNIDFYLLLDNSPSMAIAATSAGIATMVANTSAQGGCAFACHQTNVAADNLGNAGGVDNYTLAKNKGVVTRIQNLNAATQALMDTATTTMANYHSTYRMAIYTFNTGGTNTITALTSSLSSAKSQAAGIDVLTVYKNNWLTSSNNNSDEDTDFEAAMAEHQHHHAGARHRHGGEHAAGGAVPGLRRRGRQQGRRRPAPGLVRHHLRARPSRTAASASPSCTRPICRCRPTAGTIPISRRSSRRSPAT